jgi:hypothetical protein
MDEPRPDILYDTVVNELRDQIDRLKVSTQTNRSNETISDNATLYPLHPLAQRCDDLVFVMNRIVSNHPDESNSKDEIHARVEPEYDDEVVSSLQSMKQLNELLDDKSQMEGRELESLHEVLNEHQEVNRTLQRLHEQQLIESKEQMKSIEDTESTLYDLKYLKLTNENKQLHEDLLYLTKYFEEQRQSSEYDAIDQSQPQPYDTLYCTLQRLIRQRLDSSHRTDLNTPLNINPVDTNLLQDANVIDSDPDGNDMNHVSLIDYICSDNHL